MWNICRAPCFHSASDKISEYSRNIPWHQNCKHNPNENNCVKQFDEKKIMVVDSQPYNSVVSRVVNIDSKPIEPVVGRRKIIPDFVLVNNTESNELVFTSQQNSAQSQPKNMGDHQHKESRNVGDHHIEQWEKTEPDTEYRQNYTWNKAICHNNNHVDEQPSQSEYRSSFAWPKKSVPPIQDIEPPIVAERVVPGKAVPMRDTGAKKSATISNFGDVVGKPEVLFVKETQPVPVVEKTRKKSEYNSKFKPFSAYVYVTGNGFMKPKNLHQTDEVDKAKNWYSEVEERTKQANQYKTRSQLGHPLASEGLTQIYSQGSIWNNYHKDRNLQALALATTQKIIEEKKQERAFYLTPQKSSHLRQLSSAPPSLRTEVLSASSQASVRTKSPHVMSKTNDRPRSADRQSKISAISETPKPEGKIWLKPKPKTQENNEVKKVVPPSQLPSNTGHNSKSPTDNGGPKSPRPTTLATNGNGKNEKEKPKEKPPLPSGPIRTTQIKSPEEITGVRSPSPESWTVPIDRNLNWVNGETPRNVDNKYSADMTTIKSAPVSDKSKINDTNLVSDDKSKPSSSSKPMSTSTHSKPTAKVQPSPSASLSSISNPGSKRVQSIEEEVKVVKPANPRQKAGNVLDRAKHRLDHFWSRNK